MSFGSLSANAIRALNEGAKRGNFYHDTGEGSISPYHRENGGDIVWEIGSGYFGCRDDDGRFSEERFAANARDAAGEDDRDQAVAGRQARPRRRAAGGQGQRARSPPRAACRWAWTAFRRRGIRRSPRRWACCEFVARLRELSGGKPTGFKLAIGHPWEWFGIAKAMHETGILPDFIVVDGAEGGTGAAPAEFIDHVGVPMHEALMLVHNTLVGLGLRDQHPHRRGRARSPARSTSPAPWRWARTGATPARGFMFALGCIQSQSCHTDRCPTGVATQDPRALEASSDVADKATRVHKFHDNTLKALRDLLCAAGLEHPEQLGPEHILRRVSPTEVRSLAALYRFLEPGELLDRIPEHAVFQDFWAAARSDSFVAPDRVLAMRAAKIARLDCGALARCRPSAVCRCRSAVAGDQDRVAATQLHLDPGGMAGGAMAGAGELVGVLQRDHRCRIGRLVPAGLAVHDPATGRLFDRKQFAFHGNPAES